MEDKFFRHVLDTTDLLAELVTHLIAQVSYRSIASRGTFTLGVSGGSIVNILAEYLPKEEYIEWDKWKIFFCDERLTPFSDPESTYGQYKKKLIDVVGHADSWVPIDPSLNVEECAVDYEKKIKAAFGKDEMPSFDMLLLGMGPDGHTCSLFPDHKLLKENKRCIAPINDSPKPPPCRVTMTLPLLNNAGSVMFISTGASKAETIKKILEDNDLSLPASLVKPKDGVLRWILDTSAASLLKNPEKH